MVTIYFHWKEQLGHSAKHFLSCFIKVKNVIQVCESIMEKIKILKLTIAFQNLLNYCNYVCTLSLLLQVYTLRFCRGSIMNVYSVSSVWMCFLLYSSLNLEWKRMAQAQIGPKTPRRQSCNSSTRIRACIPLNDMGVQTGRHPMLQAAVIGLGGRSVLTPPLFHQSNTTTNHLAIFMESFANQPK